MQFGFFSPEFKLYLNVCKQLWLNIYFNHILIFFFKYNLSKSHLFIPLPVNRQETSGTSNSRTFIHLQQSEEEQQPTSLVLPATFVSQGTFPVERVLPTC